MPQTVFDWYYFLIDAETGFVSIRDSIDHREIWEADSYAEAIVFMAN